MKFDDTHFLANTHRLHSISDIFSFKVFPAQPDLNPFDTIGVSVTPWSPGSYMALGGPLGPYLAPK